MHRRACLSEIAFLIAATAPIAAGANIPMGEMRKIAQAVNSTNRTVKIQNAPAGILVKLPASAPSNEAGCGDSYGLLFAVILV